MNQTQTYQKVLQQLSELPTSRIGEVHEYLDKLLQDKKKSSQSFAGVWSDMANEDFQDLLSDIAKSRDIVNKEFYAKSKETIK